MEKSVLYVGLDVHKMSTDVALAEPGPDGEIWYYGKISSDPGALDLVIRRLTARGGSLIVATTVAAEVGDLSRFAKAKELMAYLGLVPAEHSSGAAVRRGPITKTGNGHARRVLVEAAWAYRLRARVTRPLLQRQEGLPESIRQLAWKAQLRLCARYRRLLARGKAKQTIVTAIARELAAFIWAIGQAVEPVTT